MTSPIQLKDNIDTRYREWKSLIDNELKHIITRMVPLNMVTPSFNESLEYAVLLGGKRLRPILGIAVHELFEDENKEIVSAVCAIELIHTASLMLDDLPCMDNAKYRRGKKTNHAVFGDAVTILASAALSVEAFGVLARVDSEKSNELIHIFGHMNGARGLVQGQLLDLASFNFVQTEKELEECYRLKTSVLFSLAALIGAVLGGATKEEREHVERFATCYGIAYQIRDDIVDATHMLKETGKDERKDEENKKPTYVSILGQDGAYDALKRKVEEARAHLIAMNRKSVMLESLVNQLLEV